MNGSDDPPTPASSWSIVRGDFFGGVAAGVVALPLALAFGVASGLGPVAGLYGAIASGIVAAVFGGTPVQITGPTGPMTLVVAGIVATNTLPSGAVNLPVVVAIIVLAGLLQIVLGLFRIGTYIRYVPYPVISGFMTGIGVIIILQQLFPMLGAEPPSSEPLSILRQLHLLSGNIKSAAVALSALTIATVFILPRFTKAVPASLVALVALTALAVLLGLEVSVIGRIPSGLPGLVMPSLDFQRLPLLMSAAIQLAFLGAIDSLLTSLVADNLTRTQHDSNRELVGQGQGDWKGLILAGYFTGGRLSDLARLKWSNVDLTEKSITFIQRKVEGKTSKARVKIPIHPVLEEYLLSGQVSATPGAPVFPELHDKPGAGKSGISMAFKRIMDKAGIAAGVIRERGGTAGRSVSALSFHSLRHSFNSALAKAGVSQELRMKLTGHSSVNVNTLYSHHELETIRNAVKTLPRLPKV